MFRVVAAQFVASVVVATGAWMIGGQRAGVSSLLGGLACAVPNGLFALNLAGVGRLLGARADSDPAGEASGGGSARMAKQATAYALVLLAGEFLKVALTIGLLILIAWVYKNVVWLALIVAVIAVLMMQAATLAWR